MIEDLTNLQDKYVDTLNRLEGNLNIPYVIKQTELKLEQLKKYALCIHEAGKEEYEGHDSHKDYYQTKCKLCSKVLNERSH